MAAEQFNFRVETELKKAFIERARENGTTASELLVGFMQQYLGIEPKKPVQAVMATDIDNRLSELEQRLSARIAALEEQRGKFQKTA
jgi:predicted HicB family RNase H-like nuclease